MPLHTHLAQDADAGWLTEGEGSTKTWQVTATKKGHESKLGREHVRLGKLWHVRLHARWSLLGLRLNEWLPSQALATPLFYRYVVLNDIEMGGPIRDGPPQQMSQELFGRANTRPCGQSLPRPSWRPLSAGCTARLTS